MKKFSEMSTTELKDWAINLYDSIYNTDCYGVSDLHILNGIIVELKKRNIIPDVNNKTTLIFEEE